MEKRPRDGDGWNGAETREKVRQGGCFGVGY